MKTLIIYKFKLIKSGFWSANVKNASFHLKSLINPQRQQNSLEFLAHSSTNKVYKISLQQNQLFNIEVEKAIFEHLKKILFSRKFLIIGKGLVKSQIVLKYIFITCSYFLIILTFSKKQTKKRRQLTTIQKVFFFC